MGSFQELSQDLFDYSNVCLFVYLAVFVMLCVLSFLNWRLAYMAKCLADKINFRCPFIGKPFICYPLPRGIETAQSSRA